MNRTDHLSISVLKQSVPWIPSSRWLFYSAALWDLLKLMKFNLRIKINSREPSAALLIIELDCLHVQESLVLWVVYRRNMIVLDILQAQGSVLLLLAFILGAAESLWSKLFFFIRLALMLGCSTMLLLVSRLESRSFWFFDASLKRSTGSCLKYSASSSRFPSSAALSMLIRSLDSFGWVG